MHLDCPLLVETGYCNRIFLLAAVGVQLHFNKLHSETDAGPESGVSKHIQTRRADVRAKQSNTETTVSEST